MALRAVGALGSAEEPPQSPGNLSAAADGGKFTSCLEVVKVRLHLLLPGSHFGQVLTQLAAPAQDGPPALLDHLRVRKAVRPKWVLQDVDWTDLIRSRSVDYLSCLLGQAVLLSSRGRQSCDLGLLHPQQLRAHLREHPRRWDRSFILHVGLRRPVVLGRGQRLSEVHHRQALQVPGVWRLLLRALQGGRGRLPAAGRDVAVCLQVVVLEEQVQVEGEQAERLQHQQQLLELRSTCGERQAHERVGPVERLQNIWEEERPDDEQVTRYKMVTKQSDSQMTVYVHNVHFTMLY